MVKGYKVFNPDWICLDKQYTCPGKFEENVDLNLCQSGMHFCKKTVDCFNYYQFDINNHIAEVIAYGEVIEDGDKCCTDKLEIVSELSWTKILELVNTGHDNSGYKNSGDYNSGNYNSGDGNSGYKNSGDRNTGSWNSGHRNSGSGNSGHRNSGCRNSGYKNSGDYNSGDYNSGSWNSGHENSGHENNGDCNSGYRNSGDYNSGDWNKCNHSTGCFNTKEQTISFFNKPSEWTYYDWVCSTARNLLSTMPKNFNHILLLDMTDEEKEKYPEAETTGGYLFKVDNKKAANEWWRALRDDDKAEITSLPNFDGEIFKEITGIDVDEIS